MKDDSLYLQHILQSISQIESYRRDYRYYLENQENRDAIVFQLLIIGEASKLISSEIKQNHPEIPWRDIIGMRNRLIHSYTEIDYEAIWKTVEYDIPILKMQLLHIADNLNKGDA